MPSRMLISIKLENFSHYKNRRPNTTTSLMKKFLSSGSKYSWTVMLLESRFNKETSLSWDTSKEWKGESLKIWRNFGLIFISQKTSGSPTKSFTKSLNLKIRSSKRVSETKSSGKRAKITPWRSWRRKTKRKEDKKRQSKSNKNLSLTSSLILRLRVMMKRMKMRKATSKLKT